MVQRMLAIWSLVPLPFLNPAGTCKSSQFTLLLKPGLENFEHYFASVWDEYSCVVVWTFFGIAFLWDWNENYRIDRSEGRALVQCDDSRAKETNSSFLGITKVMKVIDSDYSQLVFLSIKTFSLPCCGGTCRWLTMVADSKLQFSAHLDCHSTFLTDSRVWRHVFLLNQSSCHLYIWSSPDIFWVSI